MYNDNYLKNRLKFWESNISTYSDDNEMSKELSHYTCLSMIFFELVKKVGKNDFIRRFFLENVNT